jgi:hypothetical protein
MNAQQYLLREAERCRRRAGEQVDRFVADALGRLADEFERKARNAPVEDSATAA